LPDFDFVTNNQANAGRDDFAGKAKVAQLPLLAQSERLAVLEFIMPSKIEIAF